MFKAALNKIKAILKNIIRKMPLKYVIFESVPDLSDNTKAVFDEMISRGINKKYKFVWLVADSTKVTQEFENTMFVDFENDSFKLLYYKLRAKSLIFCNSLIEKASDKTISFYLTHATQIKDSSSYYRAPEDIDYCLVTSEAFKPLMSKVYGIDEKKIVASGFPRNDILFKPSPRAHQIFENQFDKIIVWYPTFRQSKGGRVVEGCNSMPIIHDEKLAIKINETLKEKNILIVLKPHFAQDISFLTKLDLSNIRIIDDSFFVKNSISSYEFVAGCDALLTDYSSIYFDYLACDKPIGVVWEDIEHYRQNRGFCMDIDYYMSGAEKIYTVDDFLNFVQHLHLGDDVAKSQRQQIRKLAHDSFEGDNTNTVVDFIIDKMNL